MSSQAIANVRKLEEFVGKLPQVDISTDHVIHGGMYARTITVPAGVLLTGVVIKVPTTLIINGHCRVFMGEDSVDLKGHNVFAASAGRKQAFIAYEDTALTMIFATKATSVEEAEKEFTDEACLLSSRKEDSVNTINITGE